MTFWLRSGTSENLLFVFKEILASFVKKKSSYALYVPLFRPDFGSLLRAPGEASRSGQKGSIDVR